MGTGSDTPKTDKVACWAESMHGETVKCVEANEARKMERLLRRCVKELVELHINAPGRPYADTKAVADVIIDVNSYLDA